jgi:NADH-ubiquinone oxidoreductase chain 5
MEGPTPVSALIHAATMVTAGVFLLIRVSPILEKANPAILTTIALLGSVTALIFALAGMFQYDLKKIIAYSTCSQLGYMFFICGTSNYLLGIFHIFTHAGFKALLFLTAGALIHSLKDEQDIRKMGGLINFYPFYALLFIISSLSLSGFPFLSGFYSKDLILELVSTSFLLKGSFSSVLGQIAAFASAYYSIRFIYFVFFNSYRGSILFKEGLHNPSLKYLFILGFLCIISIFGGFLFFDFFYGNASEFYKGSFVINKTIVFENEALPFVVKQLPLIFSILGILVFFSNSNSI